MNLNIITKSTEGKSHEDNQLNAHLNTTVKLLIDADNTQHYFKELMEADEATQKAAAATALKKLQEKINTVTQVVNNEVIKSSKYIKQLSTKKLTAHLKSLLIMVKTETTKSPEGQSQLSTK